MAFDPDAYLRDSVVEEPAPLGEFDPDAYLESFRLPQAAPSPAFDPDAYLQAGQEKVVMSNIPVASPYQRQEGFDIIDHLESTLPMVSERAKVGFKRSLTRTAKMASVLTERLPEYHKQVYRRTVMGGLTLPERFIRDMAGKDVDITQTSTMKFVRKMAGKPAPGEAEITLKAYEPNIITEVGATANEFYSEKLAEIAKEFPQKSVWEHPELLADPGWWAESFADLGTSLGTAWALGGGTALGAGAVGGLMEAVPVYERLEREGDPMALQKSAAFFFTVAALEKVGFEKIFRGANKNVIMRRLIAGLTESSTEWAEQPMEAAIANLGKEGITLTEYGELVVQACKDGVTVLGPSFILGGAISRGTAAQPEVTPETELTPGEVPAMRTAPPAPAAPPAPEAPAPALPAEEGLAAQPAAEAPAVGPRLVHTMPDGTVMEGPAHEDAIPDSERIQTPKPGRGPKIRGFAEKAMKHPALAPFAEQIAAAEESYYEPQTYTELNEEIAQEENAQLEESLRTLTTGQVPVTERNDAVLRGLELVNRTVQAGGDPTLIVAQLAQTGTTIAQLLRQYGELKNKVPETLVTVIRKEVQKLGRDLTPEQQTELGTLAREDFNARDELRTVEQLFKDNPTEDLAAKRDQLAEEADKASRKLLQKTQAITPRTMAQILNQALQGNLLVPMSQIANIVGNLTFVPLQFSYRAMGSAVDTLWSAVTGRPRTLMAPWVGTKAMVRGAAKGTKQALHQIMTGIDPTEGVQGEMIRGFRPIHSLVQAITGKDLPVDPTGRVPAKDRMKKLLEALVGAPAEPMFRLLGLGDLPFKEAARQRLLVEQAKIRGISKQELDQFVRLPDKQALEVVEQEAKETVYQQQNTIADHISRAFKRGETGGWLSQAATVAGRIVAPYVKTPLNLAWEGMQFAVPELSMARAFSFAQAGKRRQALMSMGKAITGTMMLQAGYLLHNAGLLSGDPDRKSKKMRQLQYATMPPNSLNLSGFERWRKGGDPAWLEGDRVVNYTRLGFLGITLNIVANEQDEMKKMAVTDPEAVDNIAVDYLHHVSTRVPQLGRAMVNMTMLKGTATLLRAVEEGKYDSWFRTAMQAASSIPLPSTLAAVNRARQQYIPEARGDTNWETFQNIVKGKLMMTDDLPVKRDLFGRPVKRTPQGANPWVYNLLDLTKARQIPTDPMVRQVWDVYSQTQDGGAVPSVPNREFLVPRGLRRPEKLVRLNTRQYDRFLEMVGEERMKLMNQATESRRYEDMNYERKLRIFRYVYRQGLLKAKSEMLKEFDFSESPAIR